MAEARPSHGTQGTQRVLASSQQQPLERVPPELPASQITQQQREVRIKYFTLSPYLKCIQYIWSEVLKG